MLVREPSWWVNTYNFRFVGWLINLRWLTV